MKFRRVWSFLLVVSMLIGMMPMHVHAEENHGETDYAYETMVTVVGDGTQEGVIVDETTFPDSNFRGYILSQDYGADGVLTSEELSNVTYIDVSYMGIEDLAGIEFFTNLEHLYCNNNQLTALDVSKNTALACLWCGYNQLTELDLSKCMVLTNLNCDENQLSELDVSHNTALTNLSCSANQLTALNVSKHAALLYLYCSDNQLTELDLSNNTALTYLECSANQLSELDLSHNTALTNLSCGGNQLTALDVSKHAALWELSCGGNQLTALVVSKNVKLKYLFCAYNQLTALDVNNNTALTDLFCYGNQLTHLDVSKNTALVNLHCAYNQLNDLNVTNNTELAVLDCCYNQLTELDVSKNTALTHLDCSNNQLTNLVVSNNTALESLSCSDNQLTELSVRENIALTNLSCGSNQLSVLDVSKNTALAYLSCGVNQLSVLDLSNNTAIENLQCDGNQLTELDVSKNTNLTYIACGNNQLCALDVSDNTLLDYLWCGGNNRSISATDNQFDLSTLPGFDISKASDWNGGSVNGNILTVEYETVTYTYDLGDGSTETFTLTISNFHVHIFEEIVDEKYLVSAATCSDPAVYYVSCACGEKGTETFTNGTTGTGNHNFEENVCNSCGAIEICEATFPDANFRGYITSQDYGADGVLTSAELRNVTDINASYMSIEDLTGIEYFTALIDLYCNDNQLSELDLSNNTALRTLNCAYNQLTALDVSNNTALTSLACNDNQLTELDVSSNAALEWLCCSYNQLTELDVSHNTALVNLDCFSNQLATLDVSKNTALQNLYCRENELRALNVSNNIALLSLDCASNQLTAVDVSKNTGLSYLAFSNNQLAELDVSKNTALTTLDCTCNQLTALDVSKNTALTFLNCSDNQLTALDVSKNTALQDLYCSGNKLRALNVSNNIALLSLNGAFNQLTAVDVSKNTALSYLSFRNNQLAELDVSKNTALTTLDCASNQLTALDVSNNTALVELSCGENQLTDLATSANTGLTYLNCTGNQLTVLDVSNNTALTNLACNTNQLTALDVSKNTALTDLSCFDNNRSVSATENQFDLSTLAGFDISKASDWNGGSVNGNILTAESEMVTYTYDLGNGSTETFTLTISNFHVHTFEEIVDEKYLVSAATCGDPAVYYVSCACGEKGTETFTNGTTGTGNHIFDENVCNSCGAIEICEATFPDANFRGYITSQDYGTDGVLTSAELSNVTYIDVAHLNVEDLTGIEYFTALIDLCCNNNQLTALDVSKNTALTSLIISSNLLTALDVSKNTALRYLDCGYNQLTALDVSKNIAVYYLSCGENQLTALNVSKNTALKQLYCAYNQLTALDVSKNTLLEELHCYNNQLTALDVSKNTALISLDISFNQLTALDVSKNTALTHLNCNDNQLTALDVSKNTALMELYCSSNQLAALDASKNTELTSLECSYNQLTALDVSKNTALTYLSCSANQLTKLDVSKNTALECLLCYNNQLTELDVSKNTALYNLDCDYNWLTNLDLSKNAALTDLCCNGNNRSVSATENQFDLGTLAGFDINKASDWNGGTVDGNILTVESETVTYTYDLGNGYTGDFTLVIDNFHIHTFEKIVDEQYLVSAGTCSEPAVYYVSCACGERGTETFTDGTTGTGDHNFEKNVCTSCGAIEICEATFPDANFRGYITAQDYGADGVLTSAELSNVTSIDVAYMNVEDLTGIEYFTSLTDLYCNENQLTELDVSKNTALRYLDCGYNQLTALDVSKNTELYALYCNDNQLTDLDVSKNTALRYLDCGYNQLTALDVSKNTLLEELQCYNNQLTALDVSKNTALIDLDISCNQLTALDVSKNIVLTNLSCSENELTALNVSKNTKLQQLTCYSNLLRELDVRSNTALAYLDCDSNQLSALDVSKNTALESLYCRDNQLTALDVSKNTVLTYLSCGENQLTDLDVSKNTELTYLNCESNRLSALNVSKNTKLQQLTCYSNLLRELDVRSNTALAYLGCEFNQLSALDVSKNTALECLYCWDNQLTALDVSKNTALTYLSCGKNQLTDLDVSKNTELTYLDCDSNRLSALDVSKNTALTELYCNDNQLTTLDVSKNIALSDLGCNVNQLTVLDVSKNTALENLLCWGNQLTALDVSSNTALQQLDCEINRLTSLDVSKNTALTELLCSGNSRSISATKNQFDLSTLAGFDISKASDWQGGTVNGTILTATPGTVTYTYDLGNGYQETFTLNVEEVLYITSQPTSVTAKVGETAIFEVAATGMDLTYQWQYKDPAVGIWYSSSMTGNKTASMEVGAITFRDGFQYRCKITDVGGNVIYSNVATLTVKAGPSITTQPTSAYLKLNETATFKVVATGTNLTYQWEYMDPAVGTWYSSGLTGNKTAAVQVGAIVGRNNFQYRCKVTDGDGTVIYSDAVTLTVFGIKTQPSSAALKVNETANFKVVALGNGLTYQWQYKDPKVGTWYSSGLTGNKTSAVQVGAIVTRNGFQYRCKITDVNGNVVYSNAATLTVKSGPVITTQPTSAYLKVNETATFKVVATGTDLTYQWQYKDPAVGTWYSSTLTGNKTSAVRVGAIVSQDGFQYRCKITDGDGIVAYSNAVTLTVFGIKTQPASATAKLNEKVNFKVSAVGNGLTYQWQYMNPSVGKWYNSEMTGSKTSNMTVEAIAFRNGFQYRCKITDSKGNVIYSNAATLTVKTGPSITTQPTGAYLKVSETANFKVVATGTNLTYQWEYKDPAVGTWHSSTLTGNKTSTIQVGATVGRNNFQYRCKISDSDGNVVYSDAVTLTVFGIKTQPTSATAKVNETVTFKVDAIGNGLTYQWQYKDPSVGTWYNSGMTGNKTSVMTVEAITFRNNFQYRCKITDSKGNVAYSNAVTLTVKSGPSITTQPVSATAKLNETVTFKVAATGTGLTYQWQYMNPSVGKWYNSEMTGSKTSAMKVEAIAFRDGFQYRCKITDANGNVVYSNAVTLTVKSGPSITTQPSNVTAKLNETVTFKVVATGTGLTYQWQYMNPSVGKWYNSEMTGSKTSAMKVEAIAFRDGFQYRCKITDANGNVVYSNAATLTVK